jgi:hypothetical protein
MIRVVVFVLIQQCWQKVETFNEEVFMMEPLKPENNRMPATEPNDVLDDRAEEDKEEGMDRMMDEGGGVVEQNDPAGAPILRNDLIDVQD